MKKSDIIIPKDIKELKSEIRRVKNDIKYEQKLMREKLRLDMDLIKIKDVLEAELKKRQRAKK